jgi:hypothetical protein
LDPIRAAFNLVNFGKKDSLKQTAVHKRYFSGNPEGFIPIFLNSSWVVSELLSSLQERAVMEGCFHRCGLCGDGKWRQVSLLRAKW